MSDSNDMVDLVFPLAGESLSIDYPLPLWQALRSALPWLSDETDAGILPIKGGGLSEGRLMLGQRASLILRLPRHRVEQARLLAGAALDLGSALRLGEPHIRALRPTSAQYSPMVTFSGEDEMEFIAICERALESMAIAGRLVCGRAQQRIAEAGEVRGFSLMLHGLSADHALRLQLRGLGNARKLGCGIFVSHRTAVAVGAS